MPARRGRGRGRGRGDKRIDAALDHFVAMGYASRDVRRVVADLLKLYGGPSPEVWRLLEEGPYQVVQDKLFEKEEEEEEEKQKQEQDQALLLEGGQQVEEEGEPPQHQEPAVDAAENKLIVHEVPAETESADDEVEDPMFIEPSTLEAIVPLPAVGIGYKREPCYGWLTESDESDDEEQPTIQHHEVCVPTSG